MFLSKVEASCSARENTKLCKALQAVAQTCTHAKMLVKKSGHGWWIVMGSYRGDTNREKEFVSTLQDTATPASEKETLPSTPVQISFGMTGHRINSEAEERLQPGPSYIVSFRQRYNSKHASFFSQGLSSERRSSKHRAKSARTRKGHMAKPSTL